MTLIIYSNICLSCKRKDLWLKVKDFARANKLTIEVRRTNYNQEFKAEADNYGVELPFAVMNGVALNLDEDLEGLL